MNNSSNNHQITIRVILSHDASLNVQQNALRSVQQNASPIVQPNVEPIVQPNASLNVQQNDSQIDGILKRLWGMWQAQKEQEIVSRALINDIHL
jgi:hypothetical protein